MFSLVIQSDLSVNLHENKRIVIYRMVNWHESWFCFLYPAYPVVPGSLTEVNVPITPFFTTPSKSSAMATQSGHGSLTNIMLIAKYFGLPPDQAWPGAGDPGEGLVLPEKFRGTEAGQVTTMLRKNMIRHQPGMMDREDARDVIFMVNRLVVAIDRELGIAYAETREFR
jgi:hypothetical protein